MKFIGSCLEIKKDEINCVTQVVSFSDVVGEEQLINYRALVSELKRVFIQPEVTVQEAVLSFGNNSFHSFTDDIFEADWMVIQGVRFLTYFENWGYVGPKPSRIGAQSL